MAWVNALIILSLFVAPGNADTAQDTVDAAAPSCRVVDAAVRWLGDLYLFSGNEYIELNESNVEVYRGDISEWELPPNLDAAVQWTGNYFYYFFKHPDYYRYDLGSGARGPWNAGHWWHSFFEDGIDASGNRLDVSYFFKGCKYRTWGSSYQGISGDMELSDVNLPCDIDAAWDLEDNWEDLVLLKRNRIWIWGEELEGPFDFSSHYTITSWTLCSPFAAIVS